MKKPPSEPPEFREREDVHVAANRCPYCHDDVSIEQPGWVSCQSCQARHHSSCWDELARCGSCEGTQRMVPDVVQARPTGPPPETRRGVNLSVAGVAAVLLVGLVSALAYWSVFESPSAHEAPPAPRPAAPRDARENLPEVPELPALPRAKTAEELYELGDRCYRKGDHGQAVEHLARALDLLPRSDSRSTLYTNSLTAAFRALGQKHEQQARFELAEKAYTKALQLDPSQANTLLYRGRVRLKLDLYELAAEDGMRLLELRPGSAQAYLLMARAQFGLGDNDSALSLFDAATSSARNASELAVAFTWRAVFQAEGLRDVDAALGDLERAITANPRHAEAYRQRARIRFRLAEYQGARWDHTRSLELFPLGADNDEARRSIALARATGAKLLPLDVDPRFRAVYDSRGVRRELTPAELSGPIEDVIKILGGRLSPVYAYTFRAGARLEAGDAEGAISDYDRALGLKPKLGTALNNRGVARHTLGDRLGAIEDYSLALKSTRTSLAHVWFNRALAHFELGQLEQCRSDLDMALRLQKDLAQALALSAIVNSTLDKERAKADAQRALELLPKECPMAERLRKLLASLG